MTRNSHLDRISLRLDSSCRFFQLVLSLESQYVFACVYLLFVLGKGVVEGVTHSVLHSKVADVGRLDFDYYPLVMRVPKMDYLHQTLQTIDTNVVSMHAHSLVTSSLTSAVQTLSGNPSDPS